MNIIFMGTPVFAVPSLEILLKSLHKISAVVTAPDKPQGRGQKVSQSAVKEFAVKNALKVLQPEKLKSENFINEIKSLNPDLIVVVAFRVLPEEVYSIPKFGSFNLHASLLPKYRGAAPINRVIINGESETGVTTFFLLDKVDTGNIIIQKHCDITFDDSAGSLHDKLMEMGAEAVYLTVNLIEETRGNPPVMQQNDMEATPAPKIFKEDCKIDWNNPSLKIYNFIRGLSPYPGAYTVHNGKVIKIFKATEAQIGLSGKAGVFIVNYDRIFARCCDGMLEITDLQLEGKKRMNSKEFLNGNRDIFT